MKILLLDIETAPHKAYVWGLFKQNINPEWLEESGGILCWAARWYGQEEMLSASLVEGRRAMIRKMHRLLNEADAVVHYNGTKFDIPTLNKEFAELGMTPPSPYKQVDLYKVVKRAFRFASNKMDYVAEALGLPRKTKHRGIPLWREVMAKNKFAMAEMQDYNQQDVVVLEALYVKLLPWIHNHPNHAVYSDVKSCPKCGSEHFQRRGTQVTRTRKYVRYQCNTCGAWFRSNKAAPQIAMVDSQIRDD